jgi:hypothetical protein
MDVLRPIEGHCHVIGPDDHQCVSKSPRNLPIVPLAPVLSKKRGIEEPRHLYAHPVIRRPEAANHMREACHMKAAHHVNHLV